MIEQGARLGKILDYLELSQTAVSQSMRYVKLLGVKNEKIQALPVVVPKM